MSIASALFSESQSRLFCWLFGQPEQRDRKSTRLNSSHSQISYAVFCLKKKKTDYASAELDGQPFLRTMGSHDAPQPFQESLSDQHTAADIGHIYHAECCLYAAVHT